MERDGHKAAWYALCTGHAGGKLCIHLPESVKELGQSVFRDCAALEEIGFSGKEIRSACFQGCSSLKSVSMRLKSVPDSAFRGCSSLIVA
ncbi:MAG: leucine-rich repeat protein, partial [Clostridia bacterium]|nr:leucine-rich repeat protein [Clostridia bacterium]